MSHLRLVEKPIGFVRPPCPRRLEIRLHVRNGLAPHGRSRAFRLHDRDLAELIRAAERLEARR